MLQPSLGAGLPQKLPPFFSVFISSLPTLYSSNLSMYSYFVLGFSCEGKDISAPVLNSVWMFHVSNVKSFYHNQLIFCLSFLSGPVSKIFSTSNFLGWGQPHSQSPTWITSLSLFTFDKSHKGRLASGYTTASIALRILWPHKPHHYVKVRITLRGECSWCFVKF
jgi:hypothetical protein